MYPAAIEVPQRALFGILITGPRASGRRRATSIVLTIVVIMTWMASNIVHGRIGRMWMAVRDMDIAAELMGIRLLPTKLLAFAVSSFYCGVAGAMLVFLWYGGAESTVFSINELHGPVHDHYRRSRQPAGLVPRRGADLSSCRLSCGSCRPNSACRCTRATVEHMTFMITGALIVFFLIAEPADLPACGRSASKN